MSLYYPAGRRRGFGAGLAEHLLNELLVLGLFEERVFEQLGRRRTGTIGKRCASPTAESGSPVHSRAKPS